ncbi:MAG TPA: endopeptidase La [Pseudogracilibacillus sp.]|nr:endopeptidase La [Pseudogracilibacillus sp.]
MKNNQKELPLLALRGLLIYPTLKTNIDVGRKKSVKAIERAMELNKEIILVSQKELMNEDPKIEDIYDIGITAKITKLLELPNDTVRITIEGLERVKINEYVETKDLFTAKYSKLTDKPVNEIEAEALNRQLLERFNTYIGTTEQMDKETLALILEIKNPHKLTYTIANLLPLGIKDKQSLLETDDIFERNKQLIIKISKEQEVLDIEKEIGKRVQASMEKTQKEFFLREQLKAVQEELDDSEGNKSEVDKLKEKIENAKMPENVNAAALKELSRYEKIPQNSPEGSVILNYLDWLTSIPWYEKTNDTIEIKLAQTILDEDHYGLDKVKERILEYLAVQKLTNTIKGPILCLVGPPGVGKTSLAKSIARSINRNFVRISLGGVRDEAEIRGHRRTYIGAMPGRIIQGMKRAETINPVVLLDEIDKIASDMRGDPSSAMLEVLDPEQNSQFSDHFIEETYDLSNVLFVATANSVTNIPGPLLDRMELISLSGYTEIEKTYIAKEHLIPKQIKENGLTGNQVQIRDEALLLVIRRYTREAGVRDLERTISAICRKAAKIIISGEKKRVIVTEKILLEMLGNYKYSYGLIEKTNQIGTATGLAYTAFGGDILSIEVAHYPGKGKLVLTGKLGDVMKESAEAAFSYIRSRINELDVPPDFHEKNDIHIHVPEGATPKDGPSAGITIATALISSLTGIPVKKEVGMTGEITLRGRVLPIGGLKEKSLSAHRSGLKTIIIPKENEKDIDDIPESVKKDLTFIPVMHLDEVLKHALAGDINENK